MITYDILMINNILDFDQLKDMNNDDKKEHPLLPISPEYIDDKAIEMIKNLIGTKCSYVLIEDPYYDKDYLSTFYIFYAKKFKKYAKKNIRLTFFKDDDHIIGYITLRPTTEGTKIGKTYINPRYIIEEKEKLSTYIILSKQKAHIYKEKVYIPCFPWMCQQKDITVCSHIAIWALIRSLSAKSPIYAEALLGKIAEQVEHYSEKMHSPGLTPQQISTILINNGLATTMQHLEDYRNHFSEMVSYVDSGFAFVGVLSKYTHAVAVIGYNINKLILAETAYRKEDIEAYIEEVSIKITTDGQIIAERESNVEVKMRIVFHSNLVTSLIVNDDQFIPYKFVPMHHQKLTKVASGSQISDENNIYDYMVNDIDYIVVPFYNRIQLSYKDAVAKFCSLVSSWNLEWTGTEEDTVFVRGYLAHANEYKEYVVSEWSNDAALICYSLESPKYLWCFEISSRESYILNKVDSVILIDSTASANDSEPFLYIRDKSSCYYNNEGSIQRVFLSGSAESFPCFKGGVERIRNYE